MNSSDGPALETASPVPPADDAAAHNPSGRSFMGQPGPLANLFSVELWERFSFYGMQGILAIYMYFAATQGGLGIDEAAPSTSSRSSARWCRTASWGRRRPSSAAP